jgi:ubiquinone/menaquinone biosynthesis C-methylase UbiE
MGKSDEDIKRIRKVARQQLPVSRSGKTIVIIDEMNGAQVQPTPRNYSQALSEMNTPDFIKTKEYDPKIVRVVLSTTQRQNGQKIQTPAEEVRRMIGLGADWNDLDFAEKYKEALPHMAPWVLHRVSILYLVGMASKKHMEMPQTILSAASGPSEVFESIEDLKEVFDSNEIQIPEVCDLDLSEAMLLVGNNKNQKIGDIRDTGFDDKAFDMVENSSIFQFAPADVKTALVETNRILRDGGYVFLVCNGKKFSNSFYDGIEKCGFELISKKNQMLELSSSGKNILARSHGNIFSQHFNSALYNSVFLLAKKTREPDQDIDESLFKFEAFGSAPKEVRDFVGSFRGFLTAVESENITGCEKSREILTGRFMGMRTDHQDLLLEYRTVISRLQGKFLDTVRNIPPERLEKMVQKRKKKSPGVLARTWENFGRKWE